MIGLVPRLHRVTAIRRAGSVIADHCRHVVGTDAKATCAPLATATRSAHDREGEGYLDVLEVLDRIDAGSANRRAGLAASMAAVNSATVAANIWGCIPRTPW